MVVLVAAVHLLPHPVAFLLLPALLLSGRPCNTIGFARLALPLPLPATTPLQGYNASIVAYGQTGTGKTFTMEGGERAGPARGIIPRAIEDVFEDIQRDGHGARGCKFLVRASYLQIYNEVGVGGWVWCRWWVSAAGWVGGWARMAGACGC